MLEQLIQAAKQLKNEANIAKYESYLQIKPGGYGEGDQVWAIRIPQLRKLAKDYKQLPVNKVFKLLSNPVHDLRMLALFILDWQYIDRKATQSQQAFIIKGYLENIEYINNWDLVDASCYKILGAYAFHQNRNDILISLAESDSFWANRIAIVSTFYHIRKNKFETTLQIAEKLLNHKHDIIHKGVGWMLREVGNRDLMEELDFLARYYKTMPRTMLRYAIEKFDEPLRQSFLQGTF